MTSEGLVLHLPFNPFPVLTHWPVDLNVFLNSKLLLLISRGAFFWHKNNKQKAQELLLKGNYAALDQLQIEILD